MPQMHRFLTLFVCAVALTAVNLQPAMALDVALRPNWSSRRSDQD